MYYYSPPGKRIAHSNTATMF